MQTTINMNNTCKYTRNPQYTDVCKQRDGRKRQKYLSLPCVKVQCHTFHAAPFQEPGVNISFYGSAPHPLLFSSIWAMKIKANEILLMHKMRMGKAHSSTWWHSINWWLLNSSLFVPAAALLDWDNMRVPVAGLATGSVCVCVCVWSLTSTPHPQGILVFSRPHLTGLGDFLDSCHNNCIQIQMLYSKQQKLPQDTLH